MPTTHSMDMATRTKDTTEENYEIISSPDGHDNTDIIDSVADPSHEHKNEQPQPANLSNHWVKVKPHLSKFPYVYLELVYPPIQTGNTVDEDYEIISTIEGLDHTDSPNVAIVSSQEQTTGTSQPERTSTPMVKSQGGRAIIPHDRMTSNVANPNRSSAFENHGAATTNEVNNAEKPHEETSQQPHLSYEDATALHSQLDTLKGRLAEAEKKNATQSALIDHLREIFGLK